MHACITSSPLADPPHRVLPTTLGLPVTETVRQWGKAGPNGMEGGGLLVSLAWRSRALGMARAQNKVVPSEPRKGERIIQTSGVMWAVAPNRLQTHYSQRDRPGGFSVGMITACMENNLK